MIGSPFEAMMVKNGVDATSVEGVADTPYAIPNFRGEVHNAKEGVPVLWWRSVGHTHTAQAMEVYRSTSSRARPARTRSQFRLDLLKEHRARRACCRLAAEKAGWGETLRRGPGPRRRGARSPSDPTSPWWRT